MRRHWCVKYVVTLLASTALTFHLLYLNTDEKSDKSLSSSRLQNKKFTYLNTHEKSDKSVDSSRLQNRSIKNYTLPKKFSFTKKYLKRKPTKAYSLLHNDHPLPAKWNVLAGNVTVHQGNEIQPFNISFTITAQNICKDFDNSKRKLVIFSASREVNFERRQAIRETWGLKLLQTAYNYRLVFLVGQTDSQETQSLIKREEYRYGDLVQINLVDSYRNLGLKSVAGLLWTQDHCPEADYIMKTDDDILLHVPNLLSSLPNTTKPLLMCHENRMRKILRKDFLIKNDLPASYQKYEVSENEIPGMFYPPYCSGMAYVFSKSVRDRLYEASLVTPVFFIEDVYLTGFCRHKAGVIIQPHHLITLRPPINAHQASCSFRDGRVTSQEVGVEELRRMWVELNTRGYFCPQFLGYAKL